MPQHQHVVLVCHNAADTSELSVVREDLRSYGDNLILRLLAKRRTACHCIRRWNCERLGCEICFHRPKTHRARGRRLLGVMDRQLRVHRIGFRRQDRSYLVCKNHAHFCITTSPFPQTTLRTEKCKHVTTMSSHTLRQLYILVLGKMPENPQRSSWTCLLRGILSTRFHSRVWFCR